MIDQRLQSIFMNLNYLYESEVTEEEIEKDVKKFFDAYTLSYLGLIKDFSDYSVVKRKMIKTRDEYCHLLQTIKVSIDKILLTLDKNVDGIKETFEFRKEYPIYVRLNHPKEAIKFFEKIDKEDIENKGFSYSKASKLIGISRQTISNWSKKGINGFTFKGELKVSKQELYDYYEKKISGSNSE